MGADVETESPDVRPTVPDEIDIAIIGAGFSGLCAAIRLRQEGYDDFVVLERGGDVGGTWHFNTYPACGCDVPSHLYSFSFAPNPDWSRTYSGQPEIRDYLRRCADDFGVRPHVRTDVNVTAAAWDEDAQRWEVETDRGTVSARMLIAGQGPLTEPKIPDLPGLETFEGNTMHSARWDHSCDLTGKRVASIGTGASAIQYVPAIQPEVEQLHVFQRTPPWIMPHTDRPTTSIERTLYRHVPFLQKLVRSAVYAARETNVLGFVKNPLLMAPADFIARRHLSRQVPDPELREKVTPDYKIGCKRILPSNKWYPALSKPNVELVTDGIREVRPHSIVGNDGVEREVDAIIFGTGFSVTDMPVSRWLRGRDGLTLDESWEGSPRAYLGTATPGFPNLFFLLGPNTGLGHSSMIYMIESQVAHLMDALRAMDEEDAETVEILPEAARRFGEEIDKRMEGTVWKTGCASWYLDDTGRNATLWPDWTFRFRQRTSRFDRSKWALRTGSPAREPVAA